MQLHSRSFVIMGFSLSDPLAYTFVLHFTLSQMGKILTVYLAMLDALMNYINMQIVCKKCWCIQLICPLVL